MEADLDKNEKLKPQPGELYGERLLHTNYIKTSPTLTRKKKVCTFLTNERKGYEQPHPNMQ